MGQGRTHPSLSRWFSTPFEEVPVPLRGVTPVWGKGKEEWGTGDYLLTAYSGTRKPHTRENGPKGAERPCICSLWRSGGSAGGDSGQDTYAFTRFARDLERAALARNALA